MVTTVKFDHRHSCVFDEVNFKEPASIFGLDELAVKNVQPVSCVWQVEAHTTSMHNTTVGISLASKHFALSAPIPTFFHYWFENEIDIGPVKTKFRRVAPINLYFAIRNHVLDETRDFFYNNFFYRFHFLHNAFDAFIK